MSLFLVGGGYDDSLVEVYDEFVSRPAITMLMLRLRWSWPVRPPSPPTTPPN